jgi:hypothetical protein
MSFIGNNPRTVRKEIDVGDVLTEILLDILPEEIKKSGRGREYFEERMLRNFDKGSPG